MFYYVLQYGDMTEWCLTGPHNRLPARSGRQNRLPIDPLDISRYTDEPIHPPFATPFDPPSERAV